MTHTLSSSRPVHAALRQLVSIVSICGLLALPMATTSAAAPGTANGAGSAEASASARAAAQQKVEQLKKELSQLQEERRSLMAAKPRQPIGSHSAADQRRYEMALKEWQAKVDALNAKIAQKRAALAEAKKALTALGGSSGAR